ncbi:MAG: glucokinase [Nitrobacter sp.]
MTALRVIGDIGGTYARFAVAEHGKYNALQHLSVSKYVTLKDALGEYLDALPRGMRPIRGALAVAGPVSGDVVKLTNLSWSFSIAALKADLGMSSLVVVNDFAATAMSVPYLSEADCYPIGSPQSKTSGPVGVIGPGTGLGVSALVPDAGRWILLPGEGGHSTLPPATQAESLIVEVLRTHWPHVSAERALSGAGLVNLYQALCSIESKRPEPLLPADVTDRAMRGSDPTCVKAFEVFCSMLGTVAGDLALTLGATGGIYIAGGILLRFKQAFASSPFRERFEDKGRFQDICAEFPLVRRQII